MTDQIRFILNGWGFCVTVNASSFRLMCFCWDDHSSKLNNNSYAKDLFDELSLNIPALKNIPNFPAQVNYEEFCDKVGLFLDQVLIKEIIE